MAHPADPSVDRGAEQRAELAGTADDSALRVSAHQGGRARRASPHRLARPDTIPADIASDLTVRERRFHETAVGRFGQGWLLRYGSRDGIEQWRRVLSWLSNAEIRGGWYCLIRSNRAGIPSPDEFVRVARSAPRARALSPEALARGMAAFAECKAIIARTRP